MSLDLLRTASVVVAATAVLSCADLEDRAVAIVISGPHSLNVGESAELSVETRHGLDHAYTWESSDPTLAGVDAAGRVTALAPGELTIRATGADTGVVGEHVLVVAGPASADDIPYYQKWSMSAHADASAEAFTHWNEDGAIPATCAGCHSPDGFRDLLGADGSEPGVINQAHAPGGVIDCAACHNDAAAALDRVTFPSGVTIDGLGPEARCMTCHQGRASTDSVDMAIAAAGVADDVVSDMLGFKNIHYYPAAATLYAGQVRGGYQYPDKVYDHRFRHTPEHDTCTGCHDPHSTAVRFDTCATCHDGVVDAATARDIRMIASRSLDFDGDGETDRGIGHEVEGLAGKLYTAIQRYASAVAGQAICYSPAAHPYWFKSATGAAATCTDGEAVADNAYASWTPRLVRATYNYQMWRKDPGAFAHNARYIVKLLHDAIADLNLALPQPVDISKAHRDAPGHFDGAGEAARHWDEDEAVSASCSQCHGGADGFRFFVEHGVGTELLETANGLECHTCHENVGTTWDVLAVERIRYPGGFTLAAAGHDNLCSTCHTGRATAATIDAAIAADKLSFINVHYAPAAGVKFGADAHVGYQYPGNSYAGPLQHASRTQCEGCHVADISDHTFRIADVWQPVCQTCHADQAGPEQVRLVHLDDYNGNGDIDEPLRAELDGMADKLLLALQAAAPAPLCYDEHAYPYWFVDKAGSPDGHCDPADAVGSNSFKDWTPALMRAAHNFQLARKDRGAYAHNFDYVGQLLYDATFDLTGDVDSMLRP